MRTQKSLFFLLLFIVSVSLLTAYAQAVDAPPFLPEEALLAAQKTPPPLPPDIHEPGDLLLAAGRGELNLIHLSDPIPIPDDVEAIMDIEYGNADGTSLLLDLYLPRQRDGKIPGLIFIHGGGWSGGSRKDYRYYAVRFPQLGYAVASVSYRLVSEAVFPAAVHDVKCAVRWMRANAEKYGIDPDAIAAIGGSAGGHLSMMLGYSPHVPELEGNGGHADYSSAVQAVINLYGPVDLTLPEHHDNPTLLAFFGGKRYTEVPEQYRLASPMTHLTEDAPPTLTIHGDADDIVPIDQADLLDERLKALGVSHEYLRLTGYPHTLDILAEVNRYCRWHMYRFLDKHLKHREQ